VTNMYTMHAFCGQYGTTGGDVTNMYKTHAFCGQYGKCEPYCERNTTATSWPHT
jgi:hypothetical protein